MTTTRQLSLARWIGLTAGLALAVALLLTWRLPAATGHLGADARFTATPPGELTIRQDGTFLAARALRAGGSSAGGELPVRNISPRRQAVTLVALPSNRDLDGILHLELRVNDRVLADGSLDELREGSDAFALEPGAEATVEARAWLPDSASNYEGRAVDVTVELRTES